MKATNFLEATIAYVGLNPALVKSASLENGVEGQMILNVSYYVQPSHMLPIAKKMHEMMKDRGQIFEREKP